MTRKETFELFHILWYRPLAVFIYLSIYFLNNFCYLLKWIYLQIRLEVLRCCLVPLNTNYLVYNACVWFSIKEKRNYPVSVRLKSP